MPVVNISLVVLMMLLNWFLESLKWRFLISKIERVTIKRSVRAIFSGITVSAFTPNRVGEYAGRVFCLDKGDRIQAVLITVIGSMAQLITTIVFGLYRFSHVLRDGRLTPILEGFGSSPVCNKP